MTLKCAILDDYQDASIRLADWSRLMPEVEWQVFRERICGEDNLARSLLEFDILCVMRERTPLPASLIARLPNLKMIMSTGGQNLSIDLAAASARGITVCNTAALAHPTVELTFALLLELARRPGRESEELRRGKPWQDRVGFDLFGKTFGIIGLGRLGARAAAIAKAFGMAVVAWSPNLTQQRCAELDLCYVSKEELLTTSDVVSIHMQLSARSHHIIDGPDLALMKRSAFLINTSRGPLVSESALAKALQNRSIAGAGIDVYDEEPLARTHPFRELPNIVITPHIGFVTEDNYRTYYAGAVEGIRSWLDGAPIRVATILSA